MNLENQTGSDDTEFGLVELIRFIKTYWKRILFCGLLGLLGGIAFIVFVKNQFQTTAQILVQNTSVSSGLYSHVNFLSSKLPPPNLVIEQLKQPDVYSDQSVTACAPLGDYPREELASGVVKTSNIKKVDNALQLSITRDTPEQSLACTQAIYQDILKMQVAALSTATGEMKASVEHLKQRLAENDAFIQNLNKSDIQSAVYLSKKDESMFLREQLLGMEQALQFDLRPKLISINTLSNPIYPRRRIVLLLGLLLGLALGVLYGVSREVSKNLRFD